MRNNPFLAFPLAVMVLAAGCTGTEEREKDPGPTTDPPLPGPNATIGVVQFLDCYEHGMSLEVSYKTVRPQVPPAFEVIGFTSETAGIYVQIFTCGRVVNETAVLGSAHLLTSWAFVKPRNESWTPDITSNRFLLDVATDNAAVSAGLATLNLTAAAGTFENTPSPELPNDEGDLWRIRTTSFEIVASILEHDAAMQQVSGAELLWWYGGGPFHRLTYRVNDTFAAQQTGEIHATGTSRLGSAMGQGSFFLGSLTISSSFTFTYDGSWNS